MTKNNYHGINTVEVVLYVTI